MFVRMCMCGCVLTLTSMSCFRRLVCCLLTEQPVVRSKANSYRIYGGQIVILTRGPPSTSAYPSYTSVEDAT
jgi:hypothetical protein